MDEIVSPDQICDFAFLTLQLLDKATLFSKNEVLKEYEKHKNDENLESLLLKKSFYPNGEELRFYNCSKYTLNEFLYKKEIEDAQWYTLKKEYALEKFIEMGGEGERFSKDDLAGLLIAISDEEDEIEFGDYLIENHPLEYSEYEDFKKKLKKEFDEYFNGFSTDVQDFFRIIPGIDEKLFYEIYCCMQNKGSTKKSIENIDWIVSNKENLISYINSYIKTFLKLDEKYINYDEMENFLINTLFEGCDFKEKTSILQFYMPGVY